MPFGLTSHLKVVLAASGGAMAIAAMLAGEPGGGSSIAFEDEPRVIAEGRSPSLVPRRQHGLHMTFTREDRNGSGTDLYFQTSGDLGDTFSDPVRVNDIAGEVSDHGENSPQLLASLGERDLYAVWNGKDPKNPGASSIRFSRADGMRPIWSPAMTVNDDGQPVSHSFQSAAVGPDGTIYIAWLDGRDRAVRDGREVSHDPGHAHAPASSSAVYLARSVDGGKTFKKNVRVAGNVCPCCRPSIGFRDGRVVVAWRGEEPGDLRDIYTAGSTDRGATWESPNLVARDGWRINGCPHVGPSIAALPDGLYLSWFSEAGEQPAIYLARSEDGRTFSGKQRISQDVLDPTHPFACGSEERAATVFQARPPGGQQVWGGFGVYYREAYAGGKTSPLIRVGQGKANASYPTLAFGMSGRVFVAWGERRGNLWQVVMSRGRRAAALQ